MGPGPEVRPTQTPQEPLWLEEPSLAETSGLAPLAGSKERVLEQECQLGVGRGSAGPPPPTWGTSSPRRGGCLLQSRVSCLQGGLPSAATSIQTGSLMPTMQPLPGSSPGFCAGWGGSCLSPAAPPSPALVSLCSSTCLRSPLRKNPALGAPCFPRRPRRLLPALCW